MDSGLSDLGYARRMTSCDDCIAARAVGESPPGAMPSRTAGGRAGGGALGVAGSLLGGVFSLLVLLAMVVSGEAWRIVRGRGLRAEIERWAGPSAEVVTLRFHGRAGVRRVRADREWAARLSIAGLQRSRMAWRRRVCGNRIVRIFRNRWRRLFRVYNDTSRTRRVDGAPARGWRIVVREARDPPGGAGLLALRAIHPAPAGPDVLRRQLPGGSRKVIWRRCGMKVLPGQAVGLKSAWAQTSAPSGRISPRLGMGGKVPMEGWLPSCLSQPRKKLRR